MHETILGRLSEYIDGELDLRERSEVEQHLQACADCRRALAELRAVVARAGSVADTPPERDLWPGIAGRIGAGATGRIAGFMPRTRRTFSFTLPQLAAAGIALMVLSGGMVWLARTGNQAADFPAVSAGRDAALDIAPVSLADPHFDGAVEDLERILEQGRARLDPVTVRILEQNLQAIDAAIEQSRRALERDPANTFLNNHLAQARQRKLALLRRATALTAGS